jgi:acetolactate synthase-1/2/3 large subunit
MMTVQELATAVQYELPLVILVVNNGLYGTIRMYQERNYPGRYPATELRNPDFAALARACGASGETVADWQSFPAAFERALAHPGPALLDLRVDPEAITTRATLTSLREAALAQRQGG